VAARLTGTVRDLRAASAANFKSSGSASAPGAEKHGSGDSDSGPSPSCVGSSCHHRWADSHWHSGAGSFNDSESDHAPWDACTVVFEELEAGGHLRIAVGVPRAHHGVGLSTGTGTARWEDPFLDSHAADQPSIGLRVDSSSCLGSVEVVSQWPYSVEVPPSPGPGQVGGAFEPESAATQPQGYSAHFWRQTRVWPDGRREVGLDTVPCRGHLGVSPGPGFGRDSGGMGHWQGNGQYPAGAWAGSDSDSHGGLGAHGCLGVTMGRGPLSPTARVAPPGLSQASPSESPGRSHDSDAKDAPGGDGAGAHGQTAAAPAPLPAREYLARKATLAALFQDTQRLQVSLHFSGLEALELESSSDRRAGVEPTASNPPTSGSASVSYSLDDGSTLRVAYIGSLQMHPGAVVTRGEAVGPVGAWLLGQGRLPGGSGPANPGPGPEPLLRARVEGGGVRLPVPVPAYDVTIVVEREEVVAPLALVQGLGPDLAAVVASRGVGRLYINGENVSGWGLGLGGAMCQWVHGATRFQPHRSARTAALCALVLTPLAEHQHVTTPPGPVSCRPCMGGQVGLVNLVRGALCPRDSPPVSSLGPCTG
jgi:hypothetical protein